MIKFKTKGILDWREIHQINDLLRINLPHGLKPKYRTRFLPLKFDYVWMTDRGVITKRIFKSIKADYGVKLTDQALADIGNLAKRLLGNLEKEFKFVERNFDWAGGRYGDARTCYWTSRRHMRAYITKSGGYGLCFSEKEGSTRLKGIARCLVMPVGDSLFLFNAYGSYTLESIARMYSEYKNMKMMPMRNVQVNDREFWINGEKGFLLHPAKSKTGISRHLSFTVKHSKNEISGKFIK